MISTISINLKSLMKINDVTLRKLSKLTGMSQQQLSAIKRAKSKKIEFLTIYKLLTGLSCTPNDLFLITTHNEQEKSKI